MAGTRFIIAGAILLLVARFSKDYEKPKAVALEDEFYRRNTFAFRRKRRRGFCGKIYFIESCRASRRNRTFLDRAFKLALAEKRRVRIIKSFSELF